MGAKGCNGRGGNANGKKYEGRRHGGNGGGKGKRRRASASRVEKAHETVERRVGKAAIEEAMQEDRRKTAFVCRDPEDEDEGCGHEWKAYDKFLDIIRCPECRSTKTNYAQEDE